MGLVGCRKPSFVPSLDVPRGPPIKRRSTELGALQAGCRHCRGFPARPDHTQPGVPDVVQEDGLTSRGKDVAGRPGLGLHPPVRAQRAAGHHTAFLTVSGRPSDPPNQADGDRSDPRPRPDTITWRLDIGPGAAAGFGVVSYRESTVLNRSYPRWKDLILCRANNCLICLFVHHARLFGQWGGLALVA